jgi:hypothetical protein
MIYRLVWLIAKVWVCDFFGGFGSGHFPGRPQFFRYRPVQIKIEMGWCNIRDCLIAFNFDLPFRIN